MHDQPLTEHQALLQRYRAAFEQSRDAILFFDGRRFLDANPAALALFGVPDLATFCQLHPADLSPEQQPDGQDSRAGIEAQIDQIKRHGYIFTRWTYQRYGPAGTTFPAEVLVSQIELAPGRTIMQGVVRDISAHLRTQEQLKQRENILLESQRIAKVGNWVSDFRINRITWSDEVYRIFGMDKDQWGATHESFMAAVHPDDRERVQKAIEDSFEVGPYDITHRVLRPDGQIRVVRERGETEYDEHGNTIGMLGTVQDITEQWEMQRSLEQLVAILDATPDIVSMHGADGSMLYLNAAGRRFHRLPQPKNNTHWIPGEGWQRDGLPVEAESLEETIKRFHPPKALEKTRNEAIPTAMEHGVWQGENTIYDPDFNEVPVSQVILVHRNEQGEVTQTSTVIRDITDIKRIEQALRERERRYRLSQQAAHFGVWDWDVQNNVITWDEGCWLLLGYPQDHDQALTFEDWQAMVHPEDLARVTPVLEQMLAEEQRFVIEFRYRCADGSWLWVQGRGQVTETDQDGNPKTMIGTHTDIHELKTTQEQLRNRAAEMRVLSEIIQNSVDDQVNSQEMLANCQARLSQHWPEAAIRITTCEHQLQSRPFFMTRQVYRARAQGSEEQVEIEIFRPERDNDHTRAFSNEERQLLDAVAQQMKDALRRRRVQEQLVHAARFDRLTGLSNRLHFDEQLEHTVSLFKRYQTPAALLMLDVDHFKQINDRFGHATGDRALVEVADRLRQGLRDTDIPARWGGEEFAVILPDTDLSGARVSGERLRRQIAQTPFPQVGTVTISVGVARLEPNDNVDSLLKRADDALYQAKHNGRNQVVLQHLDTY